MKKYQCFIAWILIGALISFGGIRLYYYLTDDFHVGNITYQMPFREEWSFSLSSDEKEHLHVILDQPYYYLGKGAQVYAFGSADGHYVIKFFKFKHLKPSWFVSLLPAVGPLRGFKERNMTRKLRKLEGVYEGHRIAYVHDRRHSGLIYIHLNPTTDLGLRVNLVDKLGVKRSVDLDPIVFVIQKKGKTLREVFIDLFELNKIEEAATRASQILAMYQEEYESGVWDRDHGITHNTGFIDHLPFHLDVGKFSFGAKPQSSEFYTNDLRHVALKMDSWVQAHYPAAYPLFHQLLQRDLEELLSQYHE